MRVLQAFLFLGFASLVTVAQAQDLPIALNGFDPVLLTEGVETEGSAELTGQDERYTYRFVSEENQQKFLENKAQYKIQNEFCPVAPGIPGSSSLYAVHDGKIYMFATPGCIEAFRADPDSYI